jgi:hypothetical protein
MLADGGEGAGVGRVGEGDGGGGASGGERLLGTPGAAALSIVLLPLAVGEGGVWEAEMAD